MLAWRVGMARRSEFPANVMTTDELNAAEAFALDAGSEKRTSNRTSMRTLGHLNYAKDMLYLVL